MMPALDRPRTGVVLFWCVSCGNALEENPENCHHIERIMWIGERKKHYRTGWCTDCWRRFHPITLDDAIDLHEALRELSSLVEITNEPVTPVVGWKPKESA